MEINELSKYIDHTLVSRDPKAKDLDRVIEEAIKYNFKSLCITPVWINYAKQRLHDANILVCTVIGFPYGQHTIKTKVFEAKDAIKRGVDELDFVINVSKLHDNDEKYLKKELKAIRKATKGKTIKLIIETGLLNDEEKKLASKLGAEAKFNFIKTSTGIGTSGATVRDVKLIKSIVKDKAKIKASGGVRNASTAMEMIEAGAERIGTSNGVSIMSGQTGKNTY